MFEILVIVIVALIGVVGFQNFRNKSTEKEPLVIEEQPIPEKEPTMISKASGWMDDQVTGISNKLGWKKNKDLPEQFKAWVTDSKEADAGLKTWLANLSEDGLKALTEQLTEFCGSLNLELDWLVNKGIEKDPDLREVVSEVVLSYCTACWKATESQDELQIFKTYISLIENPTSKSNIALSKEVFTALVKEGLAETAPPELFLAPDKERQTHMVETIQKVADDNRKTFNKILRGAIASQEETAPSTTTTEEAETTPQTAPASA